MITFIAIENENVNHIYFHLSLARALSRAREGVNFYSAENSEIKVDEKWAGSYSLRREKNVVSDGRWSSHGRLKD